MSIVEIFELIDFIGPGSRPFEEGSEAIKQIVLCGRKSADVGADNYFALCVTSSGPTTDEYAHEINITIKKINNKKAITAHCTCEAGNSEKCKHIVGALLYLNRSVFRSVYIYKFNNSIKNNYYLCL